MTKEGLIRYAMSTNLLSDAQKLDVVELLIEGIDPREVGKAVDAIMDTHRQFIAAEKDFEAFHKGCMENILNKNRETS